MHTDADALIEICRLQQLLTELRAGHQDHYQLRPGDRNWIASVKNFLRDREAIAIDLEIIAARFNLTADAFRKRFTRAICEQLGYCDEFYFCRAFKKPPAIRRANTAGR